MTQYHPLNNLVSLRRYIKSHGLDGFVVPMNDFFNNEYVPETLNRLKFLTGFTGSSGVCIVTLNHVAFYTDSRYLLQASQELDSHHYEVLDINATQSCGWFGKALMPHSKLGYDPNLHTKSNLDYYQKLASRYNFEVAPTTNLIDILWVRPTEQNIKPAYQLPEQYCGDSIAHQIERTINAMSADHLLVTNPESLCWLLNIRGHDIGYVPVVLCAGIISRDGSVQLFTDPQKFTFDIKDVTIDCLSNLESALGSIIAHNEKVQADPRSTPVKLTAMLGASLIEAKNPIELLKSIKSDRETCNIRQAHFDDGLALTKFLYWLWQQKEGEVDEIIAAEKLLEFRQKCSQSFVSPSFATISAYGANAAIIHYKATPQTNKVIARDNFYLLDSGGQYLTGTTDVTRTLHLGIPSSQQKDLYTLVLKGHIMLADAKFPVGTCGSQLDALARYNLWQHGLDYGHSTGHGVGYFLSVHEGPQKIGRSSSDNVALKPGMILSNEPGYYLAGEMGIRLENLMVVKEGASSGFLQFETLTTVPFQSNLINYDLLATREKGWLKSYQDRILAAYQEHLSADEVKWLMRGCTLVDNYQG